MHKQTLLSCRGHLNHILHILGKCRVPYPSPQLYSITQDVDADALMTDRDTIGTRSVPASMVLRGLGPIYASLTWWRDNPMVHETGFKKWFQSVDMEQTSLFGPMHWQ
jgi:hypothetical protein